ncbi:MAG: hypothetical protein FWB73_00370 [Treponema sp.]|nr:hypothetical protein [Treponema sp.]
MSKPKDSNSDEFDLKEEDSPPVEQDRQGADTQVNNSGDGSGDKKTKLDPDKKFGLVAFIQSSKPNKYVEAMLKKTKAMEAHTLAEWQQIVNKLLNQKVS